jgi:hypothetical protein
VVGIVIRLIRPPDSTAAAAIAEQLRDMVVAFEEVEDPAARSPVLRDGARAATGDEEIAAFLTELRRDVALWQKFQTDACYIDDDGGVC